MFRKIFNITVAFFRGVACPKCKSYNVKLEKFSVVNPELVEDARYIAMGYSIAAASGMKSAMGNYKKSAYGDICQTRDETYRCCNCSNEFETRRERVVASAP